MSVMPAPVSGPLPSGTVTFVFTDIEGSTKRWDRDRDAMQAAVRRHDELLRAAIAAHGGRVFKTIGDAFCAAFGRPEDAVEAMLDAQRALAAEDFSAVDGIRVRMAIHTGTADERNDDYFGPAVNRVARLLAIGHGGQILISGATAQLILGDVPARATLRDLGEHRLKDLTRPERVFGLSAPGLDTEFPPLRSLGSQPNNLPLQVTSFVGRDREVAEITELLARNRLVTLVGSGGIGKTRTSLQVAANALDGFGDGVWFVELAPLASGEYISTTIAQVIGVAAAAGGDATEQLVRALRSQHVLLVLDNCEHLVEASARAIAALLQGCPRVKVLASSRQALTIGGEVTYRMPSLETPSAAANAAGARAVSSSPAVELFVERARAADSRFALTDENAPTIADICRRLDGIPLAIELAASRVRILSPRQLRDRLDERFRVLTGGSRNVLPRQQTLRALIDWSYDLLDARERAVFGRLASFVNGFTLAGAVAVGGGDELDEYELTDVVASLVDKSLVLTEPHGDDLRYRYLESTRAYAAEKLTAAGERDRVAARHARYLLERFADLRAAFERDAKAGDFNDIFAAELEDVRGALDGSVGAVEVGVQGALLAAIGRSWRYLGLSDEGIARVERYVALSPVDDALFARLLTALSFMLDDVGRFRRALEIAERAVAHARACGDRALLAEALNTCAGSAAQLGLTDAAQAALVEAEAVPNPSAALRLRLLDTRAMVDLARGDDDAAAQAYEQLRRANRALGNVLSENVAAANLAELEHARGRTEHAIALIRPILPSIAGGRDANLSGQINLAGYLSAIDDFEGARAMALGAIRMLAQVEIEHAYIAIALEHYALVCARSGQARRAAIIEGYVAARFEQHGFAREHTERTTHERLLLLLDEVPADERDRLLAQGAALTSHAVVSLALDDAPDANVGGPPTA